MTDQPLRFGILGAGGAAELHAAALSRIAGAHLVAVAAGTAERARRLAVRHRIEAVSGLAGLVASGVDVVCICTPHPLHADAAVEVARAGRHIVVEKPMALTPADCDRMIAAARGARVVLSVISQRRWYEASRRVKAAIDDGRIGPPALALVQVLGWRAPGYYETAAWRGSVAGEGGGVLVNQAVHQLDLLTWFLGRAAEVDGAIANVNHPQIEVEDSAVAIVRFRSGALAAVVASNAQRPGLYAKVHVHGSTGASVGVETDRGSSFVAGVSEPTLARNDVWTVPGEEEQPARWEQEDRARLAAVDLASHYHELQLRDVVDAIREGREPAVSGDDGRATVELVDAIYRAHRGRGRVSLTEVARASTTTRHSARRGGATHRRRPTAC